MGLDIYAGTLPRYYAHNWKSAVQQWAEENGYAFQKITPDGAEVDDEEEMSPAEVQEFVENWRDQILAAFNTNGMAKYEEVDTLDAIRLAANSLKSAETDEKYLVVADPGLSTTGYLNFCKDDLFHTDTADIVEALVDEKAIPDLEGVNVLWMYAGQTAEPQERLSEVQKAKLIEIWTAVLEQA